MRVVECRTTPLDMRRFRSLSKNIYRDASTLRYEIVRYGRR